MCAHPGSAHTAQGAACRLNAASQSCHVEADTQLSVEDIESNWQEQLAELDAVAAVHPDALRLLAINSAFVPAEAAEAVCAGSTDAADLIVYQPGASSNASACGRSAFSVDLQLLVAPALEQDVSIHLDFCGHGVAATSADAECGNHDGLGDSSNCQEGRSAASIAAAASVAHLPPVALTVHMAASYPSLAGPRFELHAPWLSPQQAHMVAQQLVQVHRDAGLQVPVLLLWAEWLHEELPLALQLTQGLRIAESSGQASVEATWAAASDSYTLVRSSSKHRLGRTKPRMCEGLKGSVTFVCRISMHYNRDWVHVQLMPDASVFAGHCAMPRRVLACRAAARGSAAAQQRCLRCRIPGVDSHVPHLL